MEIIFLIIETKGNVFLHTEQKQVFTTKTTLQKHKMIFANSEDGNDCLER